MKLKLFYLLALLSLLNYNIYSQSRDAVKTSTDVLLLATPAAGFITSLALKDYQGTKQIVLGGATALASSYILKYSIKKERPDGSNNHSFPSYHTAASFQGASFIQRRYGWKYSIPAYLVAGYVGWGRIYAKKHDTWDVLAGAAIGIGSTYIFTRPFIQKHKLVISPTISQNESFGLYASMNF